MKIRELDLFKDKKQNQIKICFIKNQKLTLKCQAMMRIDIIYFSF